MIPLLIFFIVAYGLTNKVNIFDAFVKGAADGMKVVFGVYDRCEKEGKEIAKANREMRILKQKTRNQV